MKTFSKYVILLIVVCALLCVTAFAADDTSIEVTNYVADAVAVKAGNVSFTASYNAGAEAAGDQYLILMIEGTTNEAGTTYPDPTSDNILYVNQVAADSNGVVTFDNVYPKNVDNESVILLAGGTEPVVLAKVKPPKPAGVTVSGQVKSYNPGNATTVELKQNGETKCATTIEAASGSGQVTQAFSISGVAAGTYDLVVTKDGHLVYTITGVTVSTEAVDLTAHINAAVSTITLLAGDVNDDAVINSDDLNTVWSDNNYLKSVTAAGVDPKTDVNGDATINSDDLNIIWSDDNYLKTAAKCIYTY